MSIPAKRTEASGKSQCTLSVPTDGLTTESVGKVSRTATHAGRGLHLTDAQHRRRFPWAGQMWSSSAGHRATDQLDASYVCGATPPAV
jgi:hypothetical protein